MFLLLPQCIVFLFSKHYYFVSIFPQQWNIVLQGRHHSKLQIKSRNLPKAEKLDLKTIDLNNQCAGKGIKQHKWQKTVEGICRKQIKKQISYPRSEKTEMIFCRIVNSDLICVLFRRRTGKKQLPPRSRKHQILQDSTQVIQSEEKDGIMTLKSHEKQAESSNHLEQTEALLCDKSGTKLGRKLPDILSHEDDKFTKTDNIVEKLLTKEALIP